MNNASRRADVVTLLEEDRAELRVQLDAALTALRLLYEEATDSDRCTTEHCFTEGHYLSESCRRAVRRALRQSATEGWEEPSANVATVGDLIGLRRTE